MTPEKIKRVTSLILGLIFITAITWGTFKLVASFWAAFTQLDSTIAAGILAAASTVLVSVISVLYSKHLEQYLNIQKEHREKKIPIYEELIEFIFRVIYAQKEGAKPIPDKELIETNSRITQKIIIWASDDVVIAFHKFRTASLEPHENMVSLALSVEELFLAIRRDLGHKNKHIFTGQILGTFMNDANRLFQSRK
jgi:hypothetical protein